jgi:hypothetical protein
MNFDCNWTIFALDAEVEAFGTSRIASAHNKLRAEVAAVQLLAQDSIADVDWLRAEVERKQRLLDDVEAVFLSQRDERTDRLRAQLPDEMQDCTIVFKECERGHGRLTATNWVQHECQTCENERLRADNFWLAAWQCMFTDGSGLTGDENGRQICLKVQEVERLRAMLETANAYGAGENKARVEDRELLAQMMIRQSLATGHGDTVGDLVRELEPQIERLRAEVATLKKDAERYRWLRDVGDANWLAIAKRGITAKECDAAIDAALGGEKKDEA